MHGYVCTPAAEPLKRQLETEFGCSAPDFAVVGEPLFPDGELMVRLRACGTDFVCTMESRHAIGRCRKAESIAP